MLMMLFVIVVTVVQYFVVGCYQQCCACMYATLTRWCSLPHTNSAVCSKSYYRNTATDCILCTNATVPINFAIVFVFLLLFVLFVWLLRKRIQAFRAKYGPAWKDIVRILTINLSYCQISSSLPSMIQVQWPVSYLNFIERLSFVNIDVVSLLGLKCVGGSLWDFRGRLLLACFVPILIVLICLVLYRRQRASAKRFAKKLPLGFKEKVMMRSVLYLWDMFDVDASGHMDEKEFYNLLVRLKAKPEHTHPDNHVLRLKLMRDLNATRKRSLAHESGHELVLHRTQFVELAMSGKFCSTLRKDWILWCELESLKENVMSDMLLVLFLLHAPLSQRAFYFFDCVNIGKRSFLQQDYSIECFTTKHQTFVPIATGFMVFFSFLFPFVVLLQLCRHRKKLYVPEIRHRYGFLYTAFNKGAEYWELHELTRKMILIGLLVFIKGNARSAMAVLVSVMAVASLNYAKPHRNRIVFWVAQGSFLGTTFKYLSVLLLASNDELNRIDNEQFNSGENSEFVGIFLIVLDVVFIVASTGSVVAVIYLLHSTVQTKNLETLGTGNGVNGVRIVPSDLKLDRLKSKKNIQSMVEMAEHNNTLNRARTRGVLKVKKSYRTTRAEQIQTDHKKHRNMAIDLIKKKQSTRRSSVMLRVEARKKVKHSKALSKSIYFSSLEEASISKIIDAMDFMAFDQNDDSEICRQGDVADTFYIIISGACQVTIDVQQIVVLGDLDIFGEIALFTGATGRSIRSATVTKMVGKDLQLLTLSRKKFNALIASGTLNKECTAKLKTVAEQRQKVHMPTEKKKNTATVIETQEEKQQQQVEKQEEHEQKGEEEQHNFKVLSSSSDEMNEIRLMLKKTIKTSSRLRKILAKFNGSPIVDGNAKLGQTFVKKLLYKKNQLEVKTETIENLWVSVCRLHGEGSEIEGKEGSMYIFE